MRTSKSLRVDVARRPPSVVGVSRSRRALLAAGAAAVVAAPAARAQGFPTRPVRLVVPFSQGTAADLVARHLATGLAEVWGQGVAVENPLGAGGSVGATAAARAAPDGHTLLMLAVNHTINPALYKNLSFDLLRDFRPIAHLTSGPLVVVANPAFAPNTIQQLIALAKARPKEINFGSSGNGSVSHLAIEILKSQAGIDMTHVPYKGIAQMMTDIAGNQVSLGTTAVASAVPQVKAGKLKALAVTSLRRTPALPDVPTMAESGLAGYDVSTWSGIVAPAGTPDDIVAKVHADVLRVIGSKAFVDQLPGLGLGLDLKGAAEFRSFIAADLAKWAQAVAVSGAKID
jgi:tripartite-type tricarboxylate transporter receptor subunit TctC